MSNEIIIKQPNAAELMRQATDVAGVSKEIVMKTACNIKGKKYVKIEGWQAIAIAHGCILSSRSVERTDTGITAIGEVRRMDNGAVIATAEGFVGDDEKTWGSRDEYARRAMAQTRSMSRAARSAFAHVVVMIDSNLSTTPFEEIPEDGFAEVLPKKEFTPKQVHEDPSPKTLAARENLANGHNRYSGGKWKEVTLHFGKNGPKKDDEGNIIAAGKKLGELTPTQLRWYRDEWKPKPYKGVISGADLDLQEALKAYAIERQLEKDQAEVVQEAPENLDVDAEWDAESKEVA